MIIEFCTGEPGGDVEIVASLDVDTVPPIAAGDRVVFGDTRYVMYDADWIFSGRGGDAGLAKVRFYLDKPETTAGLGE